MGVGPFHPTLPDYSLDAALAADYIRMILIGSAGSATLGFVPVLTPILKHVLVGRAQGKAMCGIVGYVGSRNAIDYLLSGLRRLEYRGYDSSGVAINSPEGKYLSQVGRSDRPARGPGPPHPQGHTGIGHTRWATHGVPDGRQCPPAYRGRRRVGAGAQRRHRELPAAQAATGSEGYRSFGHGYGGRRPPDRQLPPAAAAGGGHGGGRVSAAGGRGPVGAGPIARHLRPGDRLPPMARGDCGGAAGQPDRRRGRCRRAFRGQRCLASGRLYGQDRLPGRPRVGRADRRFAAGDPPRPGAHRPPRARLGHQGGRHRPGGYKHYMLKEIFEQPESIENAMRGRIDPTRPRRSSGG